MVVEEPLPNDQPDLPNSAVVASPEPVPDWVANGDPSQWHDLDVRGILAEGRDPFAEIIAFVSDLPPTAPFIIQASFNPKPLRRLLAARGFASFGEQSGPDHWRILFHFDGVSDDEAGEESAEPKTWNEDKLLHVDLRGMEPPGPLVFILGLIDRPGMGKEVVVHLSQDPLYLYPELNERNWHWAPLDSDEDEIRLHLFGPETE